MKSTMAPNAKPVDTTPEDDPLSPPRPSTTAKSGNNKGYGATFSTCNDADEKQSLLVEAPPPRLSTRRSSTASLRRKISVKTQSASFWEDAAEFRGGTIPHSMVLGLAIGVVCGMAAYLYYALLWWLLDVIWHDVPQRIDWLTSASGGGPDWLWIPIVGFTLALGVGVTVVYMGEPGDLPYTIKCVHDHAYLAMDHVMPMVAASQFSILAGGSLGPEAPLVAICAALGGFLSRHVFGVRERNLVRKHTLMGMAGALAAFFGCPLGGSLFALEVNSRFGVEYFEHTIEVRW